MSFTMVARSPVPRRPPFACGHARPGHNADGRAARAAGPAPRDVDLTTVRRPAGAGAALHHEQP